MSDKPTEKKRVLTVGVYDYFHYGHVRLFEQARAVTPEAHLIVAVQESDYIRKFKPEANIFYSTDIRTKLVAALRCVDEVVTYTEVNRIVRELEFDIFAVGADQNHAGFAEAIAYCESHGIRVARLQRTPNISSTMIKETLAAQKEEPGSNKR